MTALDKAFIKAYGRQAPTPATPPPVPEAVPADAPAHRPVEASSFQASHPTIPPPHVKLPVAAQPEHPIALPFRPMLQVEQFSWPTICRRLDKTAATEVDRLADALSAAMSRGNKVLAIAGCRQGEGATTLLLAAARCLADRGLKVAMVDGNFAEPQLAQRLELLPEVGWPDVLAGRLPLEEVVIESCADDLALLPVCTPRADTGEPIENEACLAENLDTLAAHYDLVLVDLVPMEALDRYGGSLARGIGGRLDAIALVHNEAITPQDRLVELQHSLAATDVTQVWIIENFVRP